MQLFLMLSIEVIHLLKQLFTVMAMVVLMKLIVRVVLKQVHFQEEV